MKNFLIVLMMMLGLASLTTGCQSTSGSTILSTVETDIGMVVSDASAALTDLANHPEDVALAEAAVQAVADKTGPLQSAATELLNLFTLYKNNQATIGEVQAALNTYNNLLTTNKQLQARRAKKKN
jgi:hypothetical protein